MNNKAKFYEWLKKQKKYSPVEFRFKRMDYESLSRRYNFFEISNPDEVSSQNNDKDKEMLELYCEFLKTLDVKKPESAGSSNDKQVVSIKEVTIQIDNEKENVSIHEDGVESNPEIHINKEYGFADFSLENDKAQIALQKKCNLKKRKHAVIENKQQLSFDIVTGRYYDLNNNIIASPMATYAIYNNGDGTYKKYPRRINSFYYDDSNMPSQTSVVGAYYNDSDVVKKSLDDTFEILSQSTVDNDDKFLCVVPDTAGDFNDRIKAQIKSASARYVQVPRSVVAVYSYIELNKIRTEKEYTVYDFDAEKLTKIIIRIEYDEESDSYNIVRYGRRTFSDGTTHGFPSIAKMYIDEYVKQNGISVSDSIIKNLINTRDIYNIICGKQNILIKNKGQYITIRYDESIINSIVEHISSCVSNDGGDNPIIIFAPRTDNKNFVSVDDFVVGCQRVLKRVENKQIIYKEYLPELSLEVIRNGTFDVLELISKKNPPQVITEASMDEEVNIPIENGRFVFMAGRDKLYCPLTREEFGGSKKRDKLAMFYEPKLFPLKEPVEVELSLKYRYGDPDSYRLIATPINGEFDDISSQWCDETERIMGNEKIPEYTPQKIRNIDIDVNSIIMKAMSKMEKNWFYGKTANKGNPPFDKYDNWFALTELIYNILTIQKQFAGCDISDVDQYTLTNIKLLLTKLNDTYNDASNGYLNDGMCDFEPAQIRQIKNNILNICSMLGMFLTEHMGLDYMICCSIVQNILDSNNPQYILQLSTYISRDDDEFCVWDKIDEMLPELKGEHLRHAIRTIGTVTWRNEDWIYQFGSTKRETIQSIIDTAIGVCFSELDKIGTDYNPRKVRDMLEALLGIARLKKQNATVMEFMNCNSKKIKEFVHSLKVMNNQMNVSRLKFPFKSRIEMEVPENLRNVSSVVYPLIEILTDGNAVKLTGFTED